VRFSIGALGHLAFTLAVVTAVFGGGWPALADAPGSEGRGAADRLEAAQRVALAEFPGLRAEREGLTAEAAAIRGEAASGPPFLEWQSEGLGGDLSRRPNAADYLRVGTPFNFPGQIGKARSLVRNADSWVETARNVASLGAAAEASRRWLDVAAMLELEALSQARLRRLDEALNLQEARYQLGEIAGTEVRQLDLEHINETSRLATVRAEREAAEAALRELCGNGWGAVRRGDLEALTVVSKTPEEGTAFTIEELAAGPVLRLASGDAELERSAADLASATAWGRAEVEAEWERVPAVDGLPGFDAWGFRLTVPLPLGAAGHRQREEARARADAADASLDATRREVLRAAEESLAVARGATDRLRALEPAMTDLPVAVHSLAEQFRLGAISYLAYIDGLSRFDRIVEETVDARRTLLRARLDLALLLGDRTIFPLPDPIADEEE
jgi:outer membrane protein TolC